LRPHGLLGEGAERAEESHTHESLT
jgi:hypothetical protein